MPNNIILCRGVFNIVVQKKRTLYDVIPMTNGDRVYSCRTRCCIIIIIREPWEQIMVLSREYPEITSENDKFIFTLVVYYI